MQTSLMLFLTKIFNMTSIELVRVFEHMFNVHHPNQYLQKANARILLQNYSEEEIMFMFEYYKNHLGKNGVFSLGYFVKVGDDILKRAKALELRNKIDLTIKEETKVNTIPKRKSIFKKGVF